MTPTHATVKSLSRKVVRVGPELSWTIPSPLLTYLMTCTQQVIDCCGTVRNNFKGMPRGLDNKTLKCETG